MPQTIVSGIGLVTKVRRQLETDSLILVIYLKYINFAIIISLHTIQFSSVSLISSYNEDHVLSAAQFPHEN